MIRIGPDGQLCACAADGASAASAGAATVNAAVSTTQRLDNLAIAHAPGRVLLAPSPPGFPA
jgi:hypothetical protein